MLKLRADMNCALWINVSQVLSVTLVLTETVLQLMSMVSVDVLFQ